MLWDAVISNGVFVPPENFALIWRRHLCRWRAENVDLCSALMAIEQWGFFSVSHILWHFIMVISKNPWHSYMYSSICGKWSCHYLFYDLDPSRLVFEHPTVRLRSQRSNRLSHRGVVKVYSGFSVIVEKDIIALELSAQF